MLAIGTDAASVMGGLATPCTVHQGGIGMSRSIHENRARKGFHHVDWDEIATKRRVKRLVREERFVAKTAPRLPGTQPGTVPITMDPCHEMLFSPVGARVLRRVLARLPKDVLGGIRGVHVREWNGLQARFIRLSDLALPYEFGQLREWFAYRVFVPRLHGMFFPGTGMITLHYYARAHRTRPTPVERATMQASFLHTLLHEVAHSFDRAHRVRRGRWRLDDDVKDERFAERKAAEWFETAVHPYLNRTGVRRAEGD